MSLSTQGATQRDHLHPHELEPWLARARVIDVREPSEWSGDLGRLPEAELVPLASLAHAAREWDRSETLIMVCRSGGRSGAAQRQLRSMGFTAVFNLLGGMLAVNDAGLRVQR